MQSKIRNGKAYESIVLGLLTIKGFDIYLPIADDQGIDGILRVSNGYGEKPKYYDLQVKGGKRWGKIRCKTKTLTANSILLMFESDTSEIIWLMYEDVKSYFPKTGLEWGDVYLKKSVIKNLMEKNFDNLENLKLRIGMKES